MKQLLPLLLVACGAAPPCPVPKVPAIPSLPLETYQCEAGGVAVRVLAAAPPDAVEVAGVPARCFLVLLP